MALQAEDLLDDILSFEAGSLGDSLKDGQSSSLTSLDDLGIKPEPLLLTDAEIHALAKDRQKKDNHNMSEYYYFITGASTLSKILASSMYQKRITHRGLRKCQL